MAHVHDRARPVTHGEALASAITPDGETLTLSREAEAYVVRVRGELLMSSRLSGSEAAMAELARPGADQPVRGRVLVAGLGMGFTLRALLDRAAPDVVVDVLELLPAVIVWNRQYLAGHAGHPLDDPRVRLHEADVLAYLAAGTQRYAAILVDIDNGPEAFTVAANGRLYQPEGLAALHRALAPRGVLVVWSAFRSRRFERALGTAGFTARSVTARARADAAKGARHTLFVGTRS